VRLQSVSQILDFIEPVARSKSAHCWRGVPVFACLDVSALAEQFMPKNTEHFLREDNIFIAKQAVTAALWNSDPVLRRPARIATPTCLRSDAEFWMSTFDFGL
jgi:hypothetical protein